MTRTLSFSSFAPTPARTPAVPAGPLTPGRRRLLALAHALHYGSVENLPVVAGEPRLDDPGVRVVREVKFAASEAAPAPAPPPAGYESRPQVVALLRLLDATPNGTILVLEVKHSLPFRALFADAAPTA